MAPVPCMTTSASQGQSLLVQACLKALPHTVPGQRVNCIPGISALTDKRRLIETLVRAYGEGAFRIVPAPSCCQTSTLSGVHGYEHTRCVCLPECQ